MAFSRPAVTVNRGLPRHHRELSLTLYNILEDIGVSEEIRQMKIDLWTRYEILESIYFQSVASCNVFGSAIEGTATLGMGSDEDQVLTFNDLHVVTDPADHPVGTCLLMVQDQTTSPGYCKLQVVHNGNALCGDHPEVTGHLPRDIHDWFKFCTDKNNRLVCSFYPSAVDTRRIDRRQGPALTTDATKSSGSTDIVFSFKCNKWPECASEWLTRQRHFNWPTTEMINLCETFGCLFVPVGPADSDEQDLMWRVSFSHPERLLVTNFNSVQHKCYVLLKIIKKDLIAPFVPDSLSSYHIKTCMFYLIENTKFQFWSPENLLGCVVAVLTLLSEWTETGNCPNYFIRASNLFTRRVHGDVRQQLRQRLQFLLSDDCKFLVEIKTNNIGLYLHIQCDPSVATATKMNILRHMNMQKQVTELSTQLQQVDNFIVWGMRYISATLEANPNLPLVSLRILLYKLRNLTLTSGHTEEQTKRAVTPVLPYIEICIMSCTVALALKQGEPTEQIWSYLTSENWNTLTSKSDSFSAKMKQATFMYMLGYYYCSLDILSSLCSLVRFTTCTCYRDQTVNPFVNGPTEALSLVTTEYLVSNMIIPCVYFLPTEKDVSPTALCYEMIRQYTHTSLGHFIWDFADLHFSDWALVDAQFLVYFLAYLNHNKLNMDTHTDIDIMEKLLRLPGISHRETCYNLLGWVYKEQGQVYKAMECFRKSLEIKLHWNAAFWHILVSMASEFAGRI